MIIFQKSGFSDYFPIADDPSGTQSAASGKCPDSRRNIKGNLLQCADSSPQVSAYRDLGEALSGTGEAVAPSIRALDGPKESVDKLLR